MPSPIAAGPCAQLNRSTAIHSLDRSHSPGHFPSGPSKLPHPTPQIRNRPFPWAVDRRAERVPPSPLETHAPTRRQTALRSLAPPLLPLVGTYQPSHTLHVRSRSGSARSSFCTCRSHPTTRKRHTPPTESACSFWRVQQSGSLLEGYCSYNSARSIDRQT
jgi:hypothetical protein